ncbi:hypothetical protein ACI3KS_19300 [Microbacterium sp. ZW T5_45]|uniref:hypothetical protein n=1 Tax=Microbacterium sp. ZW T5_45 TaxID=3378080 RepID=UPI003852AC54
MEKSRRFGIVLLWVAGGFALIALITWVRAGGDLSADIEFRVPRRRRSTGEAWTYTAPAFPLFTELLMFAAAIALSGIAHIRGSLRILVVSAVVGVAAAIWLVTAHVLFVRESRTLMGAVLFALVTIGLALYAPIAEVRDGRRSRAAAIEGGGSPGFSADAESASRRARRSIERRSAESTPPGHAFHSPKAQHSALPRGLPLQGHHHLPAHFSGVARPIDSSGPAARRDSALAPKSEPARRGLFEQ